MLTRHPPWLEGGTLALALIAGSLNVVGLLAFEHQAISHLSGVASRLGEDLATDQSHTLSLLGILVSFALGAALSGFIVGRSALRLSHNYTLVLALESLLIAGTLLAIDNQTPISHYLAAIACGLQNGMFTTYSGAILRTTHVTGIVTDLGLMLGRRLRGHKQDQRKARLFLIILSSFILGGFIATKLFNTHGYQALWFPLSMCLLLLVVHGSYLVIARKPLDMS